MILEAVISGFVGGCFAGFIGGSILGWFSGWQYSSKIIELDRKINQIWGSFNSERGVAGKAENAAQEAALMAEAAAIFQSDDADKMKKLMGLAAQHPALAMKLMKKFGVS